MASRLFRRIVSVLFMSVFGAGLTGAFHANRPWLCVSAAVLHPPAENGGPVPVLRAVIEYNDSAFRLEKLIPLKMTLPPSDPDPVEASREGRSGFWIELWSSNGAVLYRKIFDDPILYHQEGVEPGGPKDAIRRVDRVPTTRTFSVLIPDLSDGDQVVFFGSVIPNLAQPSAASQSDIDRTRMQPAQRMGSVRIPKTR